MISPQDLAINLATFVTVSFDVILVALMFWISDCRHKDEEELLYWSNYIHPLNFVLLSLVFAAFFIYLAVRYSVMTFALLGASTLMLVVIVAIYYATTNCDNAKTAQTNMPNHRQSLGLGAEGGVSPHTA
jgi:Ca2+/Na+ antiporter